MSTGPDEEEGWSRLEGGFHGDTRNFDDMTQMKKAKSIKIKSIVFHYNDEGVFGIKTTYEADGKDVVQSHQNKQSKEKL